MSNRSLKFFICTRDRAQLAKRCVASLSSALQSAFPDSAADCFIIDDCTSSFESDSLRELTTITTNNLNIHIIDQRRQESFFSQLGSLDDTCLELILSSCKQLGTGAWDLAGTRNFAFLYAFSSAHENDLLIFLDDDILLEGATYQGHNIPVNGGEILRDLCEATTPGKVMACGSGYWGRSDVSILQHLCGVYKRLTELLRQGIHSSEGRNNTESVLRDISLFPHNLPIQIITPRSVSDGSHVKDRGEISGAVLAVTPNSLQSHGLIRLYNEDWIWLALLGESKNAVRRIPQNALHAAPAQNPINLDFFIYQELGEIVYRSISKIMEVAPPLCNRIVWCHTHIHEGFFSEAKDYELNEINRCIELITDTKSLLINNDRSVGRKQFDSAIEGMAQTELFLKLALEQLKLKSVSQLYSEVLLYLDKTVVWRKALRQFKERCQII